MTTEDLDLYNVCTEHETSYLRGEECPGCTPTGDAMSDERLAELHRALGGDKASTPQLMARELLAEVDRLREELAAEQAFHAKTADNFAVYAGYAEDPDSFDGLERAIELRRQTEATCERRTAELGFAQRQLKALAALVNERALAEHERDDS